MQAALEALLVEALVLEQLNTTLAALKESLMRHKSILHWRFLACFRSFGASFCMQQHPEEVKHFELLHSRGLNQIVTFILKRTRNSPLLCSGEI